MILVARLSCASAHTHTHAHIFDIHTRTQIHRHRHGHRHSPTHALHARMHTAPAYAQTRAHGGALMRSHARQARAQFVYMRANLTPPLLTRIAAWFWTKSRTSGSIRAWAAGGGDCARWRPVGGGTLENQYALRESSVAMEAIRNVTPLTLMPHKRLKSK